MRKTIFFLLFVSVCLPAQDLQSRLSQYAERQRESLVELYKHLHAHPELSFYEDDTAELLSDKLKELGFAVVSGIGGHGFAGVLRNGEGPTVMVRTDLDALPVVEKTGVSYASDVRAKDDQGNDVGVMHACGHDIHMASFVGTARLLTEWKDRWSGTLVMIGQPAEERGAGARAMLKDGLFTRFPRPDYALALHTDASLQTGYVGYREGYFLANVDSVDITIRGVGGHGALPHLTKDPIVLAAQVILALQTIVSREISTLDPAVVTVGSIHGGSKHNIISDEVKLQLTVRSYSDETRNQILAAIKRITLGIARAAGVPEDRAPSVKVIEEEFTPSTYNDPALVQRIVAVWKRVLGDENVVEREPAMVGEDFSRYGRVEPPIPIFLFRLGTIDAERIEKARQPGAAPLPSLHSPLYRPDPGPSIETGVKAMTAAVLELMRN